MRDDSSASRIPAKVKILCCKLLSWLTVWHRFQTRGSAQSRTSGLRATEDVIYIHAGETGTISVAIPAFNAEESLTRAVRSALQQTYPVLEVIIVDDASTDRTLELARALAHEDARVEVIALEANGGPATARNIAFAAAKGDWIAVLDADDAFLPERLAGMMAISAGAQIVADNFRFYDLKTGLIGAPGAPRTSGWERIDLLSFADARKAHEDFGLFQPMFHRAFLEHHGLRYPQELRHGEDFFLVLEALLRGAVFRITWEPSYLYTKRNSGWSRTLVNFQAMAAALRALLNRDEFKLSPTIRAKLLDRAIHLDDLHVRELVKGAIRERRFLSALTLAATHPVVWKFAFLKGRRKLVELRYDKRKR